MASLKSLLASAVVVGEAMKAPAALALLRPHAEALGAGPDGFAWYDPATHDRYTARAIVKQLAIGLSSQSVATFLVGKKLVVAFARWSDKAALLAESKKSSTKITAVGPTTPAKVRRAKPMPSSVTRTHLEEDVVRRQRGFSSGPVVSRDDGTTHAIDLAPWASNGVSSKSDSSSASSNGASSKGVGSKRAGSKRAGSKDAGSKDPAIAHEIASMRTSIATCAADARIALLGVTIPEDPKAPRPSTLRVIDGAKTRMLDAAIPFAFDSQSIDDVGFVDDDIVILPSDSCYRGGAVKRPLVLRPKAKTFVELDGLPDVKVAKFTKRDFPPFAIHGFARTGNGTDVLLWSNSGYSCRAFKRTHDLGTLAPREISSVPGTDDSFFLSNDERVFEIRAGKKPVHRLAKAGRIYTLAPGPDGAVLASLIRARAPQPIALAWWPASREYAAIPGALFGFAKGEWFTQGHIGYHPTARLVWGFEPISDDLRAISWDVIAALPRTKE